MSFLFLLGGFVAGVLTIEWARSSDSFTAALIVEGLDWIKSKLPKRKGPP